MIMHVRTGDQRADVFTKAMAPVKFEGLRATGYQESTEQNLD